MAPVTVSQLWRFPVKSMGGTPVDTLRVDRRGAHADRLWAVRDLDNSITASARKLPALLGCSARYLDEPGDDAGPGNVPAVVIRFPDGSERHSSDRDIDGRLSEVAGRPVQLTALPATADTSIQRLTARQGMATFLDGNQIRRDFGLSGADRMPDISAFSLKELATLARYSTPPGTFVDISPVHLLSTRSLTSLSPGGKQLDPKRFRPNILVDVDDATQDYPESGWIGSQLRIGSTCLRATTPTVRCVVPTRPQDGIALDRSITRLLAERTNRFLGIYADVEAPGVLRVGDAVAVIPPSQPNTLHRNAIASSKRLQQRFQRLLELTILRPR